MTPTVGVVLVNHNGLADMRDCLKSLAAVDYPRFFPVVVDNASFEDPTPIVAEDFPGCDVLRNAVDLGSAGGNNVGIRHCLSRHADYVILLNNDTRVAPQLIEHLVRAAPGYGVIGPMTRDFDAPCGPEFFQRQPVPLKEGAVVDVDIVSGCCAMISAAAFRKIGMIDERFFMVHEETDFCLRARRAGLRCGVLGEALVWHKGSMSFRRSPRGRRHYYDIRNLFLLLTKHARLPGERRGRLASLRNYFRHAYALWESAPADAVLEGVCDALLRRFGPYGGGPRPGLGLLRRVFEWRRRNAPGAELLQPIPAEVAA